MPSICWTWNVLDMDPTFIYEGSKNLDNTAGTVFFRKNYFPHAINLKTAAKVSVLAKRAKKGTGLQDCAGCLRMLCACGGRDSIISEQPGVVLAGAPR